VRSVQGKRSERTLQISEAMVEGSKASEYRFKLWKPTIWNYICKFILSESFAVRVNEAPWVLFG
jgi:hypothetical protein